MKCSKCNRQMDYLHLLKRYECYYCDYTLHKHEAIAMNHRKKALKELAKLSQEMGMEF